MSASSRGAGKMATERTSALASSGLETSSARSIQDSPRSTTISPSATAGERPSRPSKPAMGWRTRVRPLAASLTLKLVILVGIFIALPVILYGQSESADRQMRQLGTRAIEDRSQLIADAVKPLLQDVDPTRQVGLNADLGRYSSDGTVLKLMFHPTAEADPDRFYFVA